jgi:sulfhydrogenase subunit beta (sulfur reductase)
MQQGPHSGEYVLRFDNEALGDLLALLDEQGYETLGPTLRDGVIVYDVVTEAADLPRGWRDVQEAGQYRLERRADDAYFGFNGAPQSWKRELFPPRVTRFEAETGEETLVFRSPSTQPRKRAFLGVRACELAAIRLQDEVLLGQVYQDPDYAARRQSCLLIAVNCTEAGGTCFCADMNTGPAVGDGADLVLTEVVDGASHWFLLEVHTDAGAELASKLENARRASMDQIRAARRRVDAASRQMGRSLNTENLREDLLASLQHPGWNEIATRCVGCANCTLVCPTCFCTTTENLTDLDGAAARQERVWDSCFSDGFSHMHMGPVRKTRSSRYRQWLTHKLATWHDQFGSSGCVGCGRCITWCPVGIDITAEAENMRQAGRVATDDAAAKAEENGHARP